MTLKTTVPVAPLASEPVKVHSTLPAVPALGCAVTLQAATPAGRAPQVAVACTECA